MIGIWWMNLVFPPKLIHKTKACVDKRRVCALLEPLYITGSRVRYGDAYRFCSLIYKRRSSSPLTQRTKEHEVLGQANSLHEVTTENNVERNETYKEIAVSISAAALNKWLKNKTKFENGYQHDTDVRPRQWRWTTDGNQLDLKTGC